MSDIEELELIDPSETYLRKTINIDKRKLILCLTLGVLVIIIVISVTVIPKEDVKYPDYGDITNHIEQFSIDFPEFTKSTSIGKSTNFREISTIFIEDKETKSQKQLVWVVCGIHAREWTSPLACLHFITKILEASKNKKDHLLKKFRFKIIPVTNPDGYVYSHAGTRLFRKNRNSSGCKEDEFDGVDLNRNFPVGFSTNNSDVCSDTYAGTKPFSEQESRALRDAFQADIPDIFLSIHGNAQILITPYAYRKGDNDVVKTLTVSGTKYPYGPASSVMRHTTGGTMMDWVAEDLGVNRTYTLELRSLCEYEDECHWQPDIKLARENILPQAFEILNGILTSDI